MMCPEWALLGTVSDQALRWCAQVRVRASWGRCGRPACRGRPRSCPASSPLPVEQQGPVGGDLVWVGAASGGGHAADARDPHREDVQSWWRPAWGRSCATGRSCRSRRRELVEPWARCHPGWPRLPAPAGRPGSTRSAAAQQRESGCREGKHGSLRGAVRHQENPSAPENLIASNRRPSTLAAVSEQTEQRQRSCVSRDASRALSQHRNNWYAPLPLVQRKPSEGVGRAGWRAGRAAARAG